MPDGEVLTRPLTKRPLTKREANHYRRKAMDTAIAFGRAYALVHFTKRAKQSHDERYWSNFIASIAAQAETEYLATAKHILLWNNKFVLHAAGSAACRKATLMCRRGMLV